jgi:hypothetical protein
VGVQVTIGPYVVQESRRRMALGSIVRPTFSDFLQGSVISANSHYPTLTKSTPMDKEEDAVTTL